MLSGILTGAPIWVWPLLIVLIVLGVIASRDRTRLVMPMYFFWLLGAISLNAVSALAADAVVWVGFGLAYLVGAGLGFQFQKTIIVRKFERQISMKGEWVTLVVLMAIFWMNFVGGIVQAISPEAYGSFTYHIIFATVAGLVAGSFLGRSLRTFLTPMS